MAFCSSCGAELPADAEFCPKCGKPAGGAARGPGPSDWMGRREMRHAYRQARRDARWGAWTSPEFALINTVFGGLTVIVIGMALYLAASGLTSYVTWSNFWAYMILGIGVLLIIRGVLTMAMRMRFDSYGNIAGGLVLTIIGGAFIALTETGWNQYFWILAIVGLGLFIIAAGVVGYLFSRR